MGEAFLARKAKRFKNKQEQTHEAILASPDLLTAISDHREILYRFDSSEPKLSPGTKLIFIDEGFALISVLLGLKLTGSVDAVGSADLRQLFARFPALENSIPATVASGPDWAGYYSASLDVPEVF